MSWGKLVPSVDKALDAKKSENTKTIIIMERNIDLALARIT
jgi:hypothetical protein